MVRQATITQPRGPLHAAGSPVPASTQFMLTYFDSLSHQFTTSQQALSSNLACKNVSRGTSRSSSIYYLSLRARQLQPIDLKFITHNTITDHRKLWGRISFTYIDDLGQVRVMASPLKMQGENGKWQQNGIVL